MQPSVLPEWPPWAWSTVVGGCFIIRLRTSSEEKALISTHLTRFSLAASRILIMSAEGLTLFHKEGHEAGCPQDG